MSHSESAAQRRSEWTRRWYIGTRRQQVGEGCGFTMCQIIVVYYCSSAVLSLNACHTIVVYYTLSKQGILSILTALACGGYGWGRAIQSSDPPPSSVQQPPSPAFRLHLLRSSAAGRPPSRPADLSFYIIRQSTPCRSICLACATPANLIPLHRHSLFRRL